MLLVSRLWGIAEFGQQEFDVLVTLPINITLNFAAIYVSDRSQSSEGVAAYGIIRIDNSHVQIYRSQQLYSSPDSCSYLIIAS